MATWDPLAELRAAGFPLRSSATATPLPGGVSSDIWLVEDGPLRIAVKRALSKLRVADDWFADTGRNRVERDFLADGARIAPESVPRVFCADPAGAWFAMEYLDEPLCAWKAGLLAGRIVPATARLAGSALGRLHAASWGDPEAQKTFDTLANFIALRIEPYLLAVAERVPAVARVLRDEAARLASTRLALVHGDYSPKNLMVGPGRLVMLDAETAWYGDPAFDTAFLLNHLFLKGLLHAGNHLAYIGLAIEAWRAYIAALGTRDDGLERRTMRLVPALMLARVRGKSPVEYLADPAKRRLAADFACRQLLRPAATMRELAAAWRAELDAFPPL